MLNESYYCKTYACTLVTEVWSERDTLWPDAWSNHGRSGRVDGVACLLCLSVCVCGGEGGLPRVCPHRDIECRTGRDVRFDGHYADSSSVRGRKQPSRLPDCLRYICLGPVAQLSSTNENSRRLLGCYSSRIMTEFIYDRVKRARVFDEKTVWGLETETEILIIFPFIKNKYILVQSRRSLRRVECFTQRAVYPEN